ncbi:MAG: hypothetical protein FWD16_01130 [Clostridia bacterium]|nr:hypothetical protein [Clostridia bacterium]
MPNKNTTPKEFMSIADCAKNWKLPSDKIVQFCEDGEIAGAAKRGDVWIIPITAKQPAPKVASRLSKTVVPTNSLQEAALKHIEEGVPFDVHEHTIGNRTFIVSSIFQRQGPTIDEHLVSLAIHDIEKESGQFFPVKDIQDLKQKVRKNSNAAKATFDDYIYTYRERLKRFGFSDGDIEVLLERIAADYEPFVL